MNNSFRLSSAFIFLLILFAMFPVKSMADITDCNAIFNSPPSPENPVRFKQGYCSFENGSYSRAINYLLDLEKALPFFSDYILYFRGASFAETGNTDQAMADLDKIIRQYNSSVLYKKALAKIAEIHDSNNNYDQAIKTYNQLVAIERSSWLRSRYINRIAEIYENTDRVSQAFQIYRELWTNYPQTNYSEKITEFSSTHGLKFEPSFEERKKRADIFFEIGLREEALKEYRQLPESAEIKTKIAICLYYTDRKQEAYEILNEINSPEADFWRGKILEKEGKTEDAIKNYFSSYLFFPANELAQKSLMIAAELDKSLKQYDQAYEKYKMLLKKHPASAYAKDAAWNTGWIYYLRGEYNKSLDIFSSHKYPDYSLDSKRFLYWKAKSLEKMERKEEAYKIYKSIAHSDKYTYHAFLSRLKIGYKPKESIVKQSGDAFNYNPSRKKLEVLLDLGLNEFAANEADKLREETGSFDESLYLSSVYYKLGDFYSSVAVIEARQNPEALFYSFPRAYEEQVGKYSAIYSLNELIVFSLMREESRFDRKAVSGSDARGLMQLLPATAVEAAEQSGVNPFTVEMLFQPETNIALGTFYLRKMLDRFGGNIPVALAAYNAGPNRIAELLLQIEFKGFDEFVEKIPIFETKDYVKKILRSYGAYRAIYGYE